MLPEFDVSGQEKLLSSAAMIFGLGGLGSPVAMYLAAAGVGELVLVDDDEVDLSNLQRQIIHSENTVGDAKTQSAAAHLRRLNSATGLTCLNERLEGRDLESRIGAVDIVIDATDNFSSRYAINDACVKTKVPLVSGAAIRMEGQVAVFDPRDANSPCYRCLYPEGDDEALNCAENGVIAPLVGIIGTVQAMEVIKVLTGVGESLVGYVLYADAKRMDWRKLKLTRDPNCPTCGEPH